MLKIIKIMKGGKVDKIVKMGKRVSKRRTKREKIAKWKGGKILILRWIIRRMRRKLIRKKMEEEMRGVKIVKENKLCRVKV